MATIVETLGQELAELDREYTRDFAGHSRLSRDVGQLDKMIARAESVIDRVRKIPSAAQGPELLRVQEAAEAATTLFRAERQAIAAAQNVGPTYEEFSMEATAANLVFARYSRHFAGQDRGTRDAALLGELVEELKQIDKRMGQLLTAQPAKELERDREIVRTNLSQYQKEIELIEKAQAAGTAEEQASTLATLANGQFTVYQAHFAGEPRVSRRPTLLLRVISTLKKVRERMAALTEGGLAVEFNANNQKIVDDRLSVYETELAEIRKIRQATPMVDLMGELGSAANKLFDEYRGNFADKPRAAADATRLANICDKLAEIRRQMLEMSWAEENDMNLKNLDVVTEQLVMFENEYEAVAKAQTKS